MPFFRTGILQDAWVEHTAVVEAASAEEAQQMAYDQWKGWRDDVKLIVKITHGFDNAEPLDLAYIEEISEDEYKASIK
jgi:hypothetical protein